MAKSTGPLPRKPAPRVSSSNSTGKMASAGSPFGQGQPPPKHTAMPAYTRGPKNDTKGT
jgi:hypothetical protein